MTLAWVLKGTHLLEDLVLAFFEFVLALIFLLMTSTESGILICLFCTCPPREAEGGKEKGPGDGDGPLWTG